MKRVAMKALIGWMCCSVLCMPVAHAGLFDVINQAAQVANAVRGQPTPPSTPAAPAGLDQAAQQALAHAQQQALQQYAALDCPTLRVQEAQLQTALTAQAQTPTAQVNQAAGMLSKASGLFGAAGALVGVDTQALKQASDLAQQANQVNTGLAVVSGAGQTEAQLLMVRQLLQSKTCS
jgi:hypothetical protein